MAVLSTYGNLLTSSAVLSVGPSGDRSSKRSSGSSGTTNAELGSGSASRTRTLVASMDDSTYDRTESSSLRRDVNICLRPASVDMLLTL